MWILPDEFSLNSVYLFYKMRGKDRIAEKIALY